MTCAYRYIGAALIIATAACAGTPGDAQVAHSAHGMVATAKAEATRAAADVLARGGNAVDAAIAASFVLSVVEPSMSGLGGRAQYLMRLASGELVGVDGSATLPAAFVAAAGAEPRQGAHAAVGTPGMVAAAAQVSRRHGTLPLAELIQPAIRLAEDGFVVSAIEAAMLESSREDLLRNAAARQYFLKSDGTAYQAGDVLRQPDLARTLRRIAEEGPEVFYQGAVAESIARDMAEHGGYVTMDDLRGYRAEPMRVLTGTYRGHTLVTNSFPSSGAVVIGTLQTLESFDLPSVAGSARWGHTLSLALGLALQDRRTDFGSIENKERILTSRERADQLAGEVRRLLAAGTASRMDSAAWSWALPLGTTHISVADTFGNVVALTQSLGPAYGARAAAPGLGFLYASTLVRNITPEQRAFGRPILNQSPVLVLRGDEPVYALGAGGGARIVSSVVSVLSRLIDGRMTLEEAVGAPRLHPRGESGIELESSWTEAAVAEFEAAGWRTAPMPDFARIHGIEITRGPTPTFTGVADPRRDGTAAGPGS